MYFHIHHAPAQSSSHERPGVAGGEKQRTEILAEDTRGYREVTAGSFQRRRGNFCLRTTVVENR